MKEHIFEFIEHFESEGTPIMFGGGEYAYTLLGVDYNEMTAECFYLILDPHYTASDSQKSILEKQAVFWKNNLFF